MVKRVDDIDFQNVQQHFAGLIKSDLRLLSTITGYQENDKIFIEYHCIFKEGPVDVRTSIPLSNPVMKSITPVLPGAVLYEREMQDLLGVIFEEITDSRRLVLPEDWKDGVYPLRKDYKYVMEGKQNG